jgi:hypothetical protein
MKLYTTLRMMAEFSHRHSELNNPRLERLINSLSVDWSADELIDLVSILEFSGVNNCLWALRTIFNKKALCHRIIIKFKLALAKKHLPNYEKNYPKNTGPRECLDLIQRWIINPGEISDKNLINAAKKDAAFAAGVAFDVVYIDEAIYRADVVDVSYQDWQKQKLKECLEGL